MTIDKSEGGSFQCNGTAVSSGAFDKASRIFSLKEALALSKKDYVIIFFLALISLVMISGFVFMKPLGYFDSIPKEQMQSLLQENMHKGFLQDLKDSFLDGFSMSGMYGAEMWRASGWNGVWILLFFIPLGILGVMQALFSVILVFFFILNCELKKIIQKLEKSSE